MNLNPSVDYLGLSGVVQGPVSFVLRFIYVDLIFLRSNRMQVTVSQTFAFLKIVDLRQKYERFVAFEATT